MRYKHYLLSIILIIGLAKIHGQKIQFNEFTTNDVLISNNITCIYQDSYGFIWIGTKDGLNRYDGSAMVSYKFRNNDTASINDNIISAIGEDKDENLWIGTNMGINRYIRQTNNFQRFYFSQSPDKVNKDIGVREVLLDSKNNFWLCTGYGLKKLVKQKPEEYSFEKYFPEPIFIDSLKKSEWSFLSICEDGSGNIWTGTWGGGLMRFYPDKGKFKHFKHDPLNHYTISSNIVTNISELDNNLLLIGTYDKGINIFNPNTNQFINYKNSSELKKQLNSALNITSSLIDRTGQVWIGTSTGLYVFKDWANNKFKLLSGNGHVFRTKINDEFITDLYANKTGTIWYTSNRRIAKFNSNTDKFSKFRVQIQNNGQKDYITDFAIYKDNSMFISTFDNGLIHCKPNGKIIKRYTQPEIVSNSLNAVFIDTASGKIWCGGNNGISIIDLKSGKIDNSIKFDVSRNNGLNEVVVTDMETDVQGNVWITTQNGVDVFDPSTHAMVNYPLLDSIKLYYYHGIYKDHQGNIILFGEDGAAKFNIEVTKAKIFKRAKKNLKHGLCNNKVKSVVQDSLGRYWFGTLGGISVYDQKNDGFFHFFDSDGLSSQIIRELISFKDQIWVKTANSISSIDIKEHSITNYFQINGLEHNGGTIWKGKDGKIYVAGEGSFSKFNPNEIKITPNETPIYFTGIWINGKKIVPEKDGIITKEAFYTKQITLNQNQRFIRLSFSALDYASGNKSRYKYILEGHGDTNWHDLGTQNEITLNNLSPGDYILKVKGANINNVWNNLQAVMKIKVLPPWWKTWPAIVMLIFIFLVITSIIIFLVIKRERILAEKRKTREINQMKIRFFTDISHELRTPITLIYNPIESILKNTSLGPGVKSQLTLVYKNALRVLKLINQLLDFRKLDAGKYMLSPFQTEMVAHLKNLAETFTFETKKKDLYLNFKSDNQELWLDIDASVIEKIVANLLSNAIKNSPQNGIVSLEFKYEGTDKCTVDQNQTIPTEAPNGYITICISDQGKGIPDSEKENIFNRFYRLDKNDHAEFDGFGIGLNLVKEMTDLLHGRIEVKDNTPQGTIFQVVFPVSKATLEKSGHNNETILWKADDYFHTDETAIADHTQPEKHLEKVLLVEDHDEMRQYVASILSYAGYQVIEATNGLYGFEKAISEMPDLVISDIRMPVEDGMALCRKLKSNTVTDHIPVILLSAKSRDADIVEGLNQFADDYIIKPFNTEILLAKVKNLIEIRNGLKKIFQRRFFVANTEMQNPILGDEKFLLKIRNAIEENLDNPDFNVETLAEKMHFSRTQLNRKVKSLLNLSPLELIRQVKMEKAKEILLQNSDISISELGYKLGFKTNSHFTRVFKEYYNKTPREFLTN